MTAKQLLPDYVFSQLSIVELTDMMPSEDSEWIVKKDLSPSIKKSTTGLVDTIRGLAVILFDDIQKGWYGEIIAYQSRPTDEGRRYVQNYFYPKYIWK